MPEPGENASAEARVFAAIERGAPVDLVFQSIAGTQAANASFGIDLALLRVSGVTVDGPAVMARLRAERDRFVDSVLEGLDDLPAADRMEGEREMERGVRGVDLGFQRRADRQAARRRCRFDRTASADRAQQFGRR